MQVSIPNLDARRQPDYALFRSAADRTAADARKGTIEYWRDVPVLGDAKKWSASLDKQRGADENPSGQIANYLYRSRVRWGILTNGRYWRLYEREKSSAGGVFYEVNLEDLLKRNDPEAFKYFYLFFRRQAMLPDPTGRSFIDKVFQGSVDYATAVGDSLKESVYDALRLLMNGFFEHPGNDLNRNDPAAVKLVHENCLIVLYRLLFLLFAEDKELLPMDNPVYKDHSLKIRHQEVNQRLRMGRTYLPGEHRFWGELTGLFELIDNGLTHNGEIVIPAYNGGLFNPQRQPRIKSRSSSESPSGKNSSIPFRTEVSSCAATWHSTENTPSTFNALSFSTAGEPVSSTEAPQSHQSASVNSSAASFTRVGGVVGTCPDRDVTSDNRFHLHKSPADEGSRTKTGRTATSLAQFNSLRRRRHIASRSSLAMVPDFTSTTS